MSKVSVDVLTSENRIERFGCELSVKGGGKWKRVILSAAEFKAETTGAPLRSFSDGRALCFDCEDEDTEYAITNILWL